MKINVEVEAYMINFDNVINTMAEFEIAIGKLNSTANITAHSLKEFERSARKMRRRLKRVRVFAKVQRIFQSKSE